MKRIFPCFFIPLSLVLCVGLSSAQTMYQNVIGGAGGNDFSYFSQLTSDSGQILVGSTDQFGSGAEDVYLVKTKANGDTIWAKAYGNIGADIGHQVIQTSDGGYMVVGQTASIGAGGLDVYAIRTDANGDTLWTRAYGGALDDIAHGVDETFDGGFIICGYSYSYGSGFGDMYVVRTDSMGDTLWTKRYTGGFGDYGLDVKQTMDSGFIFAGECWSFGAGQGDVYLVRTDSMGDTLWTKAYGGTGYDGAWSVQETADSGYVMAGWTNSFGAGNYDYYVVRTDVNGDTLWTRAYGGAVEDVCNAIAVTADSGYIIGGHSYSFAQPNANAYVVRLDAGGDTVWTRSYGGVLVDVVHSVNEAPDGGFFIGGYTYSFGIGDADAFLVKTDANGNSNGDCYEGTAATVVSGAATAVINTPTTVASGTTVTDTAAIVTNTTTISRDNFYVSIITSTNLSCNGDSSGSAVASVVGGTLNYTYLWNDPAAQTSATADTLNAGTWQVVVTGGYGCQDSASVIITEPSLITPSLSKSDVTCFGDSSGVATVDSINGGFPPYTYLWDDPATQTDTSAIGLNGGTYRVTITDSTGCSVIDSVQIVESTAISLSMSSTISVACNTDASATATVTATGGSGTLTYLWNDPLAQTTATATGLASAFYQVTVNDSNGCIKSDTITIGLVASITSISIPVCGGICNGSITATVTGATAPLTYVWNDPGNQSTATVTGLCGGTYYTIVVTDGAGCTSTDSINMNVPSPMSVTLNIIDINCFGNTNGSLTTIVSGGGAPYTYNWLSPLSGSGATQTNLAPGSYDVMVTDNNGCALIASASITQPTAALSTSISIVSVKCKDGSDGAATVTASGGTSPYTYKWQNNGSKTADTLKLVAGSYTVTITDNNGCSTIDTAVVTEPNYLVLGGGAVADTGSSSGIAWVVASGGSSPYTYLWNDPSAQVIDTAYGLTSGIYMVSVTDKNGCSNSTEISVSNATNSVFEHTYEGDWDDFGRAVDEIATGGFIVAGYTESFGNGSTDIYLVKTDDDGNLIWAKTYGGSADDGANSVVSTNDGGFIIAGYTMSFGSGANDMYVIKTDSNGDTTWTRTYGGSGDERAYSVVELSAGGFLVAGGTNSFGSGESDAYMVQIDINGTLQWAKTYGGSGYDYGYSVSQASDGDLILAGYTYSFGSGDADAYLVETDITGEINWTKVYGGPGDDEAWSVKESDGGYVFAGRTNSFNNGDNDVYLVKTDDNGTPLWTKVFGGNGEDLGYSVSVLTGNNGYAIAGYSTSFSVGSDDIYLIKTDNSGTLEWSKTYGGAFDDRGWAAIQTADQGLVIAGNSKSFSGSISEGFAEVYLIKTEGNGNSQCNHKGVTSTAIDTTGTISLGGTEGIGGIESMAASNVLNTNTISSVLCYQTVGLNYEINEESSLIVYPNPNNGNFYILMTLRSQDKNALVRIYNVQGELILEQPDLSSGTITRYIELNDIEAGVYFVQLVTNSGVTTKKVICQ